ncbi:MAG: DUF3090 family protein [Actinomycetota bacterium]
MSFFYEFDEVDTFTTGTVGRPGSRTFYLFVRAGTERLAVKCEKVQTAAVAQYLEKVLVDLPPPEDRPLPGAMDVDPTKFDEVFVLGPIGLGYDRSSDRVLLQLEEMVPADLEDDSDEGDGDTDDDVDRGHVRLYITRGQAAAFASWANDVVQSGRPECRWCSGPIDPDGHACPRMN